jgi:hypothetical protein
MTVCYCEIAIVFCLLILQRNQAVNLANKREIEYPISGCVIVYL